MAPAHAASSGRRRAEACEVERASCAIGAGRLAGRARQADGPRADACGKGGLIGGIDDEHVLGLAVERDQAPDRVAGKAPEAAAIAPARGVDPDPHLQRTFRSDRPPPSA